MRRRRGGGARAWRARVAEKQLRQLVTSPPELGISPRQLGVALEELVHVTRELVPGEGEGEG
eukprot:scaffold70844_cov30-Phaeocystis_antarctica.AAC.1